MAVIWYIIYKFIQYWREIAPDTAYMVFLSVSLGFPYMVSVFPCFPAMVFVFPCFPYMVMLPKYLNVKAIVLDRALLWAAMDVALCQGPLPWRHNYKTFMVSWTTHRPEREPATAITGCQSVDYFLDFKGICCIFPWNNPICIIGRYWRLGAVPEIFNNFLGIRPSDTLSSGSIGVAMHARENN